jgi:hypothetical protein
MWSLGLGSGDKWPYKTEMIAIYRAERGFLAGGDREGGFCVANYCEARRLILLTLASSASSAEPANPDLWGRPSLGLCYTS